MQAWSIQRFFRQVAPSLLRPYAALLRAACVALALAAAQAATGAGDTQTSGGASGSQPPAGANEAQVPGGLPSVAPSGAKEGASAAQTPPSEFSNLDNRIEDTKKAVIELNRDLMVLEEELLFPASTQVAVFVSMDVGKLFDLDSVQVKVDDREVANYLYTPAEVQALHRGGVQRIYLGNLKTGSHELVAFFTGGGPHQRDYRRATSVKFDKGTDPKYIELRIKDSTGKQQPEFDVHIWPGANSPTPPTPTLTK